MLSEHMKRLSVISSLLAIAGLVLMFSSVTFGTSLGVSWLGNQENGMADTDQYNIIVETFINNFVITGSILFGAGLFVAILTYLHFYYNAKRNFRQ